MTPHKISILVRADVGRGAIELLVTGCLTAPTARILSAQIARARDLQPFEPILVDLTGVQHLEPAALEELRAAEAALTADSAVPLRFALPEVATPCPLSSVG